MDNQIIEQQIEQPIIPPKRKSRNGAKDKKPRKSHRSDMPKVHVYFCNGTPYLSAYRRVDAAVVIIKEYFNTENHLEKLAKFLGRYREAFGVEYRDYIRLSKKFIDNKKVKDCNGIPINPPQQIQI